MDVVWDVILRHRGSAFSKDRHAFIIKNQKLKLILF